MRFTAVVTCHDSDPNPIVKMLLNQTRPPDEIMVECSGNCKELTHPVSHYELVPDDRDFGYKKRNRMSSLAAGDWLGFFCHDDSYHPKYIERMVAAAEGADVVYCEWTDIPNCRFAGMSSTLGNFIVKKSVFESAGMFPQTTDAGLADASLINNLVDAGVVVARDPILMYYHNIPYAEHINPTVWGQEHEYRKWMKERATYSGWKHLTDLLIGDAADV